VFAGRHIDLESEDCAVGLTAYELISPTDTGSTTGSFSIENRPLYSSTLKVLFQYGTHFSKSYIDLCDQTFTLRNQIQGKNALSDIK
jgi:hypothetical protein